MSAEYIEYSSFDELCCDSAYYDGMSAETHQTECLAVAVSAPIDYWIDLIDWSGTFARMEERKKEQLRVDSK